MSVRKPTVDRRADIREATLALAFERGLDQVTTSKIAARLGLTQPAIYKHFPGKEELWASVTAELIGQIDGNIDAAIAQADGAIDRLRRVVLGHLRLVHATPGLPVVMVARPEHGAQAMRTGLRGGMARFSDTVLAAIREAQDNGDLRADIDAQDISTLVLGVVQSLVLRFLITREPSVLLKDADRLLDLQLAAFAPTGEKP